MRIETYLLRSFMSYVALASCGAAIILLAVCSSLRLLDVFGDRPGAGVSRRRPRGTPAPRQAAEEERLSTATAE